MWRLEVRGRALKSIPSSSSVYDLAALTSPLCSRWLEWAGLWKVTSESWRRCGEEEVQLCRGLWRLQKEKPLSSVHLCNRNTD